MICADADISSKRASHCRLAYFAPLLVAQDALGSCQVPAAQVASFEIIRADKVCAVILLWQVRG